MASTLKFLATLVGAYLVVALAVAVFQRRLQYFPDHSAMDPERAGLAGAQTVELVAGDGTRLVAWWKPPIDGRTPVYLYFHGNGGNLMLRGERFAQLTRDGAGILALSWRGYGGSAGSPTEEGLHLDAAAAHEWVRARVAADRLVLFGESLGTAPAIRLAARRDAAALVLDSPYSSALDIARDVYFWLPVRLLMRDPFRAIEEAPNVRIPVFAVHCRRDPVIPLRFAQRLAAALPGQPELAIVEEVCHVPPLSKWRQQLDDFLMRAVPR